MIRIPEHHWRIAYKRWSGKEWDTTKGSVYTYIREMTIFFVAFRKKTREYELKDPFLQITGVLEHQYEFGERWKCSELRQLEERNNAYLPDDYRFYLTFLGDGGPGPSCGIDPLNFATLRSLSFTEEDLENGNLQKIQKYTIPTVKGSNVSISLRSLNCIGGVCGIKSPRMIIIDGKFSGQVVSCYILPNQPIGINTTSIETGIKLHGSFRQCLWKWFDKLEKQLQTERTMFQYIRKNGRMVMRYIKYQDPDQIIKKMAKNRERKRLVILKGEYQKIG